MAALVVELKAAARQVSHYVVKAVVFMLKVDTEVLVCCCCMINEKVRGISFTFNIISSGRSNSSGSIISVSRRLLYGNKANEQKLLSSWFFI